MSEKFKLDKNRLLDSVGRPLTQSLFLEIGYSDYSVYTLKEHDYTYKGKFYPSLKALYLAEEDPTEYNFATKHLLGWRHWQRLLDNKQTREYIEEWREELELKLRSQAVRDMINMCSSDNGNFSAAKWLADRGWEKRAPGRPGKDELEKRAKIAERVNTEFDEDFTRLNQGV